MHIKQGQWKHHIKTSATKKRQRVLVSENSSLRVTEDPVCCPDYLFREVCCLPGAFVRDIKMLLSLIKLEDYYLFVLFQVGSQEAETRKLKNIKKLWIPRKHTEGIRSIGSVLFCPPIWHLGPRKEENRSDKWLVVWMVSWSRLWILWSWTRLKEVCGHQMEWNWACGVKLFWEANWLGWLPSFKLDVTEKGLRITEAQLSRATSFSEGIGRQGGVGELPSTLRDG